MRTLLIVLLCLAWSGGVSADDVWIHHSSAVESGGDTIEIGPIHVIAADSRGRIWAGEDNGLFVKEDGVWTSNFITEKGVNAIAAGPDNDVWVGYVNNLFRFEEGTETFGVVFDIAYPSVLDVGPEGTLCVGFKDGGFFYRRAGEPDHYVSMKDGLRSNHVSTAAVAPNGDIWCGYGDQGGVSRFDGVSWVTYTEDDGLAEDSVYSIAVNGGGIVYANCLGGMSMFENGVWIPLPRDGVYSEPRDDFKGPLCIGPSDELWALELETGKLVSYNRGKWSTQLDFTGNTTVYAFDVDGDGTVWIGTGDGIWEYSGTTGVSEEKRPLSLLNSLDIFPNPFNASTVIRFSIPESGPVTLDVYNAAGQKVRSLMRGICPAGTHASVWDGRDDRGNPVSSGVYVTRLQVNAATVYGRMLFLK